MLESHVPFSIPQMHDLGLICLHLETLTLSRIFHLSSEYKDSIKTIVGIDEAEPPPEPMMPALMYSDPKVLLPPMNLQSTDAELMVLLDSLSVWIDNATARLVQTYSSHLPSKNSVKDLVISTVMEHGRLDAWMLEHVSLVLNSVLV